MDAITFNCSGCQQLLKVPAASAGKQAKCPRCGAALTIPAGGGPAAAPPPQPYLAEEVPVRPREARYAEGEYAEDRGRGRPHRRHEESEGGYLDWENRTKWAFVRIGLLICFIALCALAGAYGIQQLGTQILFVGILGRSFGMLETSVTFIKIGTVLYMIGFMGCLAGNGFCLAAPTTRGALGVMIAATGVGAVYLILFLVFILVPAFREGRVGPGDEFGEGKQVILIFTKLLFYGWLILMGSFLRVAALSQKAHGSARSSIGFIILSACAAGYFLIVELVPRALKPTTPGGHQTLVVILMLLNIIQAALVIGILIWLLLLCWRTRNAME